MARITGTNWAALGDAVIARRVELGMRTREAFARRAGLSTKTLGEIERAGRTSYHPATLAQVEAVLGWPADHSATIVNGQPDPPPESDDLGPPWAQALAAQLTDIRALLEPCTGADR